MSLTPKARRFWPLFSLVLLTDCATKRAAETHLVPVHVPHEFLGELVRLTLAYNPGAAMSLSLGEHSRLGFSLLALAALFVLAHVYHRTSPGDRGTLAQDHSARGIRSRAEHEPGPEQPATRHKWLHLLPRE